jgi:hypothetical protein
MLKQTNEYLNNSDCRTFSFSVSLLENKTLWHQAKQHMYQPIMQIFAKSHWFFLLSLLFFLSLSFFFLPFSFFPFKSLTLQKALGI